jgi:Zn finger protein HypA/HybF involved in hydrogenase expression
MLLNMVNMTAIATPPFAVYVHWPFCLSKCPYCDFNSHVRHGGVDEARFVRAFEREIMSSAERTGARVVSSVFFGGGTPSLMQPSSVQAILDAIDKHWGIAAGAEITLEANPSSVEATRFRGYRAAGVNRVSLGVQSLDDAVLKELGSPSSRRRRLPGCTPPASWRFQARIWRAISTTSRNGSASTPACRLMKSPITRGRAPSADTTWSIGAATNMPVSALARMAGSTPGCSASPPKPRSGRKAG